MKDFDVKALGGAKLPEGVKITKELKRQVDGKEASIFIGTKNGEKVRYTIIDGQAKELVATNTTGKNKYTTKEEFEAELMNKYGMSSKDFAQRGIIAEYKHGKLTFTNIKSGEKIPDAVLAQQESKHAQDVANQKVKDALKQMPETTLRPVLADLGDFEVGHIVAVKKETDDKDVAQVKPQGPSKKPKTMQGQRAVGPEITVIGDIKAKARKEAAIKARDEKLDKEYPRELAINDKRIKHVSGGTYIMELPKPQGNGKREYAHGHDIYHKEKVGNKEIFLRANLTPEQRQKVIDAELAKQKAEAEKAKATAAMQEKRQAVINKGKQAGRLVGITPDKVLDQISTDVKGLNAGTVKSYMDGYKQATDSRERNNFFHQLWKTSHYGKNEAQWKKEKLDIMNKVLSELAKTPGANTAKFEKTVYKAGKKGTVTLTLDSVMKELQQAKANLQKGIPADETVRDVERIMSRFGYGNANA